jgi:hypothetical protein
MKDNQPPRPNPPLPTPNPFPYPDWLSYCALLQLKPSPLTTLRQGARPPLTPFTPMLPLPTRSAAGRHLTPTLTDYKLPPPSHLKSLILLMKPYIPPSHPPPEILTVLAFYALLNSVTNITSLNQIACLLLTSFLSISSVNILATSLGKL